MKRHPRRGERIQAQFDVRIQALRFFWFLENSRCCLISIKTSHSLPQNILHYVFQEKDVAKARAALLSRAQKMLHRGGADLEAAGANTASKLCFAR